MSFYVVDVEIIILRKANGSLQCHAICPVCNRDNYKIYRSKHLDKLTQMFDIKDPEMLEILCNS